MTIAPLGDSAAIVELGPGMDERTLRGVRALAAALEEARLPGVVDVVPAYATVAVYYDPLRVGRGPGSAFETVRAAIGKCAKAAAGPRPLRGRSPPERFVEIPVCYGGEHGPDLEAVAVRAGVAPAEAARLHSEAAYTVQAIGFTPGFPFLAGLPAALNTPRRSTPRETVPAGSVGIGGAQTGVYPLASPGGWNLIGRTPLRLFRAEEANPSVLRVGDRVRFRPITAEDFAAWK